MALSGRTFHDYKHDFPRLAIPCHYERISENLSHCLLGTLFIGGIDRSLKLQDNILGTLYCDWRQMSIVDIR